MRGDDLNAINEASQELSQLYSEAGQAFYQAQNQTQQPGAEGAQGGAAGEAAPPPPPGQDDVVEADYEIVDDAKK